METDNCPFCGEEIMASANMQTQQWLNDKDETRSANDSHCLSSAGVSGVSSRKFPVKSWKMFRNIVLPILIVITFIVIKTSAKALFCLFLSPSRNVDIESTLTIVGSMLGIIVGVMYFFLGSYVQLVSKYNRLRFNILAIFELLSGFIGLAFLGDESTFDDDSSRIFAMVFALIIMAIANAILYIWSCSALFDIQKKSGIKGMRLLGIYMLVYVFLDLFNSLLILAIPDGNPVEGVFFALNIILMVCIMVRMGKLFNTVIKTSTVKLQCPLN